MTKSLNKQMLKITILVLTFSQMATNGLSPAMSDLAAAFPDVATSAIQMLMTLPGIFVVFLSLISASLTSIFPKKYLIGTGSLCICATAVLGTTLYQSLPLLFAWSALMGIGMGLISALTVSLISDYFEGQEKETLMGLQTSAANLGGMIMTAVGGVLTAIAWNLDYLVYLIALPGLLLLILFVPKETPMLQNTQEETETERTGGAALFKNKSVWIYVGISVLMLFLFNAGPTNLSMYVTEFGIGNSVVAGWAATVFLLGGTVMGILFGKFSQRLGVFTIPLGFLFMAVGFLVMVAGANIVFLYVGCLLAGMSISLVSPQCILQASSFCKSSQELAMAAAAIMAASNIGTFLTPQITNFAQAVTGSESTLYRFILALGLALVMAVATLVLFVVQRRVGEKSD
ncbi:MAG: MFS transporter [Clostridiales bacterium]|nr:MFS transporter [Clostridiales bacterium]